jgi:DHA1 family tetracycline resistance protein-like MFS transporter
MFLDALSVGLVLPVMPGLILALSDLPVSRAAEIGGYLLFVFAAMQFVFAPVLGALSDRFGRRPVLLLAVFGFSLDYFVMAIAPSLVWLFVARLLSGFFGATYAAANAAIVDITPPEQRARNFGFAGAAIGVGLIFGPAIGGLLGEYSIRLPFIAAGVVTMALCLIGYFVLPETLPPEKRRAFSWTRANPLGSVLSVAQSRIAVAVLAALFCVQLASQSYNSIWAFFTIEVAGWSPRAIGLSVALYGFLMAVVQGVLTGPVVARVGEIRAAYFSISIGVVVYLGLAFADGPASIYFWVVAGSLSGFAFPALQSLLSKNVDEDAQGELQGVVAASYSLTAIIGPLAMTQVFSAYTGESAVYMPGAPFILASALIVVSFAVFSYGVGLIRKTGAKPA